MWNSHVGMWNSHIGMWNSHIGMWNSHIGMWNSHIGMWNSHIGMWNSKSRKINSGNIYKLWQLLKHNELHYFAILDIGCFHRMKKMIYQLNFCSIG